MPANSNQGTQDKLTVDFVSGTGTVPYSVGNWTAYTIERDFFTPADAFTLVLEDDRAEQLNQEIRLGTQCNIKINGKQVMVGYVDSFDYTYDRHSGKRLVLRGRDLLGQIEDSVIFPNLGLGGQTDFQFDKNNTLLQAFTAIFSGFDLAVVTSSNTASIGITVDVEDNKELTFATGFATGIKAKKTKTPRGLARSLRTNLNHLLKPNKGEKYLSYAKRLADHVGAEIKMAPGSADTIIVNCPTYDRVQSQPVPFAIYHSSQSKSQEAQNNVHNGRLMVSYKDQPSVVILEGTHGSPTFRKQNFKVLAVNELTAYQLNSTGNSIEQIPSVTVAINQLVSSYNNSANKGIGYMQIEAKQALISQIPSTLLYLQTPVYRPVYELDNGGFTAQELQFMCAKRMADHQRKYLRLEYTVDRHTQNNVVYYPNMLCHVYDDTFDEKKLDQLMWIEKVAFQKNRASGTETKLSLSLPYVYAFDITND